MQKREVKPLSQVLREFMRSNGLETPLLQKRLIDSWPTVMGEMIATYTSNLYIRNQTLYVQLNSPALRQNLSMARRDIAMKMNQVVQAQVITDVVFC